jgi:hypothetical protein
VNPLVRGLPTTVTVGDTEYPISTSHRTGIRFEALAQSDFDDRTKFDATLALYFPEIPKDLAGAMEAAMWFYTCGKPDGETDSRIAYKFDHDHDIIHASFMREYGINIYTADLHWWEFRSLLFGLSDESPFMKAIGYRLMTIPPKLDREQREFYTRMKRIYALPTSEGVAMTNAEIYEAKFGLGNPLP